LSPSPYQGVGDLLWKDGRVPLLNTPIINQQGVEIKGVRSMNNRHWTARYSVTVSCVRNVVRSLGRELVLAKPLF